MKRIYSGLSTRRIVAECQPLMQKSNVKIKATTKGTPDPSTEWKEETIEIEEFGLSDISISDITP